MKQQQSGFTLIELVMVIVILGILAATALPKFVNLKSDAEVAATAGVAGGIASGNTINFANWSLHPASAVSVVADCTLADSGKLLEGGMPPGYTSAASGTPAAASGVSTVCVLKSDNTANTAASAVYVVTRTQ